MITFVVKMSRVFKAEEIDETISLVGSRQGWMEFKPEHNKRWKNFFLVGTFLQAFSQDLVSLYVMSVLPTFFNILYHFDSSVAMV